MALVYRPLEIDYEQGFRPIPVPFMSPEPVLVSRFPPPFGAWTCTETFFLFLWNSPGYLHFRQSPADCHSPFTYPCRYGALCTDEQQRLLYVQRILVQRIHPRTVNASAKPHQAAGLHREPAGGANAEGSRPTVQIGRWDSTWGFCLLSEHFLRLRCISRVCTYKLYDVDYGYNCCIGIHCLQSTELWTLNSRLCTIQNGNS